MSLTTAVPTAVGNTLRRVSYPFYRQSLRVCGLGMCHSNYKALGEGRFTGLKMPSPLPPPKRGGWTESGADMSILPHVKQRASGKLCSSGSSALSALWWPRGVDGRLKREGLYVYLYTYRGYVYTYIHIGGMCILTHRGYVYTYDKRCYTAETNAHCKAMSSN